MPINNIFIVYQYESAPFIAVTYNWGSNTENISFQEYPNFLNKFLAENPGFTLQFVKGVYPFNGQNLDAIKITGFPASQAFTFVNNIAGGATVMKFTTDFGLFTSAAGGDIVGAGIFPVTLIKNSAAFAVKLNFLRSISPDVTNASQVPNPLILAPGQQIILPENIYNYLFARVTLP